jgi:myo-inositol-1(or 4)-monophosphatase
MTFDLKLAINAAAKACVAIKSGYEQTFDISQKNDKSLVTSIDQAAERIIIDELQKQSPHAILSEESGQLPGSSGLTWVIDPIDGTTNFSRHHLPFAVSIGLMDGDDSCLGVIHNPLTDECFYAESGSGTFLNGQQVYVSSNADPARSILFFNFGSDIDDRARIVQVVDQLIYDYGIRTWGTTAWELCAVAKGAADGFICVGDKLWDFAAGICLIKEAGGRFTDWRGRAWSGDHTYFIASNQKIHAQLVERVHFLQQ